MKINQSRKQGGSVAISAQASGEELKNALDYAYNTFALNIGLKVSPGQTIEEAAKSTLGIADLTPQIQPYLEERLIALAVDKSGIMPAFEPESAILSQPKSGSGICLDFTIVPKPTFELSSYEPVSISVVRPVVFDEDIEREMAVYEPIMGDFDDPDKNQKLRALVTQKLEDLSASTFLNQKRQAVSIELAKRLEGDIADEIMLAQFADLLDGLKSQLRSNNIPFADFLQEHGGEENVNMLLMWQAREVLRQGYALDALYRHEKLSVSEADIDETCCAISGMDDARKARENARAMGKMHSVKEAAQRFKATDWALERAEITVRDRSPLET